MWQSCYLGLTMTSEYTSFRETTQSNVYAKVLSPASKLEHQRIYVGELPYKCKESGKAFIQCSCLWSNERIYVGEATPNMPNVEVPLRNSVPSGFTNDLILGRTLINPINFLTNPQTTHQRIQE